MSHSKDKVYRDIGQTLQRFKFDELEEMMDALKLESLSIPNVVKKLKKAKLPLNGKTFAQMALKEIKSLNNEELLRLSHCLLLFDKAYHTRKAKWTCIELLEKKNELINADSSIEAAIVAVSQAVLQNIRIMKLNAFVEVIKHADDYYYILIREKKILKGRGVSLRSPIFCVCNLTEPYLFFAPKVAATNIILTGVTTGLGYNDMRLCALDGKSIQSLTKILKNRNNNNMVEVYNPVDVVRKAEGLNYCMDGERKNYASKVFGGEEPIELESLTVTATVPFRGLRVLPEAEAENIQFESTLKITAPSLSKFVQDVAADRAIKIPFPSWLSKVPHLGN